MARLVGGKEEVRRYDIVDLASRPLGNRGLDRFDHFLADAPASLKERLGGRSVKRGIARCSMHGGVLLVSPLPDGSCREAVRAFLYPMGRSVHTVEARLTKADGVIFTSELWMVGTREISGIAEEIATWLATKSRESRDLEATITIRAGRPIDRYSHRTRWGRAP
jgi:hypothetical protein